MMIRLPISRPAATSEYVRIWLAVGAGITVELGGGRWK